MNSGPTPNLLPILIVTIFLFIVLVLERNRPFFIARFVVVVPNVSYRSVSPSVATIMEHQHQH